MRTFARDSETNDIAFGYYASKTSGTIIKDVDVLTGRIGVLSVVEAIVKTEKGELALDSSAGIDHVGLLANGESMLPFWKKDLEDSVERCPNVIGITRFDVDLDRTSGIVKYTLAIDTEEGEAGLSGTTAELAKVSSYGYAPKGIIP